jgi:GNAT superfamily N-acetyltransferase
MRTVVPRKSVDCLDFGAHAGDVEVRLHDTADEFRAIAEPLYRSDPVAHTIELTLLSSGVPDESLLMTVWDNSSVVGAALQTPPYPLACSTIHADLVDAVVAELAQSHPELSGVRGVRENALTFANAWHDATGRRGTVTVEERLYRLGTFKAPDGVAGAPRLATADDRALLVDWVELFYGETFGHPRNDNAGRELIDRANRIGDRFLLWTVDGTPVSTAMLRAPAAGVSRIGPVFTPRARRGHGYGSAVTAAASELARRSGTEDVVLFADLANPTSNKIYQQIGFEPVADSVRIDFTLA